MRSAVAVGDRVVMQTDPGPGVCFSLSRVVLSLQYLLSNVGCCVHQLLIHSIYFTSN